MPVLCWNKPERAVPAAEHALISFDGGPAGGYLPNMSDEDARKWKAKLTGTRKGFPQVEIRKSFPSVQMLVIVSLGNGYTYKHNKPADTAGRNINVHMALNGGAQMSFAEMTELQEAVEESRQALLAL